MSNPPHPIDNGKCSVQAEESLRFRDGKSQAHESIEHLSGELARERDTLQAIMESTNAHVAYLDRDFNFVMVNSTYASGSGHTREELIGRNHFDVFPDSDNQAIFERVRDTGEPVCYKAKPFQFSDQPWRGVTYWDWTLIPIKDQSGTVQGLVLSLVDVTDVVRAEKRSSALNDINAAVNSTLDFDKVMHTVVQKSAEMMGADSTAIILREDDHWVIKYAYGAAAQAIGGRLSDDEADFTVLATATKTPVVSSDYKNDPRLPESSRERWPARAAIFIPLVVREEAFGVIAFFYYRGPVDFTESDTDSAVKLASSVSMAAQNARLFAELQEAKELAEHQLHLLQLALLPAEPRIGAGYDLASYYEPAFPGLEIGGDFYDVFRTEDSKIGIFIGDVSGKGIEAASLAAAARSTICAFTYDMSAPGEALSHANSVLLKQQAAAAQFLTVFLAVLDLATGSICYSSAGHPSPVILRCDGHLESLSSGDPPVGLLEGFKFREFDAFLQPGDKVVMYTDGISEARYDHELFGTEGVEDVLRRVGKSRPQGIVDALVKAALDWAHGELKDDTAIIAIEREYRG